MKNIIEKIKKGEIKMKPKIYFALKTFLMALSVLVVSLFVLYLISFVLFSVRAVRGPVPILFALPWLLVFVSVILIIILEILVRHFSFAYRRPILYTVLAIIILVLLGSFLINKTRMHPFLFDRAEKHRLPIMGPMYRGYGPPAGEAGHPNMLFMGQPNRLK